MSDDTTLPQTTENGSSPRFGYDDGGLIEGEPTWDRMTKLAAICVALTRKHFGETLDYSSESMAVVDRVILSGWGSESKPTGSISRQLTTLFGAYIGEVLTRRTRGRWVSGFSEEEPASILYLGARDSVLASFSPFMFARQKFEDPVGFDLQVAFAALEQKLEEGRSAG